MAMVLVNMFVAILTDAHQEVTDENKKEEEKLTTKIGESAKIGFFGGMVDDGHRSRSERGGKMRVRVRVRVTDLLLVRYSLFLTFIYCYDYVWNFDQGSSKSDTPTWFGAAFPRGSESSSSCAHHYSADAAYARQLEVLHRDGGVGIFKSVRSPPGRTVLVGVSVST